MRKLVVTCDDVGINNGGIEACKRCLAAGILTSGSVIINSQRRLLEKVKGELSLLSLGLHLNVFEGRYENDRFGLFGKDGLLRRMLYDIERSNGSDMFLNLEQKMALRDEFKGQVECFAKFFGYLPSHLSYHYGIHFVDEFYQEYWHVAEGYDLPFRFAPQYTKLNPGYKKHPDLFLDQLNNRMIEEKDMFELIGTVIEGQTAELCLHLDDNEEYKIRQIEIFSREGLKEKLEKVGISLVRWWSV